MVRTMRRWGSASVLPQRRSTPIASFVRPGTSVMQTKNKVRNEKFTSSKILMKKFKMGTGTCCTGPKREAKLQATKN